ncbi:inositol 1,4,5-trisphosphate receptor-interacting protein-like 1 [Geospiza fortis]|uniref:Inositol 1,4,5-trisphosphate receptor-interacting protein-like 1 n=1 Tax=Geospiza fortis TaxID=48883 RepID=A0A6I9ZBZ7_GEOFO|nr:inositol 1,4,5-trisphosphate receptor-interacting protein-like 1 [Geospiza fortis]
MGPLLPAATSLRLLCPTVYLHSGPTEPLLCVLLQTMALLSLLFMLVQSLIQYPQPAGDGLDEATHRRMKECQELLEHQMARLLQELEQPDEGWEAMLFGALQQWPFWVLAGVLLLLGLCFSCRRRSRQASNNDVNKGADSVDGQEEYTDVKVQQSSYASEQRSRDCTRQEDSSDHGNEAAHSDLAASEDENKEVIEEDCNERNKDKEQGDVNMQSNKKEDRKEGKQGHVAASEKEDSDGGKEAYGSVEDREKTGDVGNEQGILLVDHIEWPVEDLETVFSVIAELMESLMRVFVDSVSHSFYPVPQETIRVCSAFEGWSPCDWDGVYRVLVPLNPPPGHAFHLELNSAGQVAARTFCVHVELVCTCEKEQLGEKPLCFLHQSRKWLGRKQKRSLLETLCTDSYLDGGKTSHWFCQLVRSSWLQVPQWHSWHLVFQPCSRSCRLQLSKGRESLRVEMLFGVRQGDSDIFVVSQPTEAQKGTSSIFVSSQPVKANMIASTVWPTTYSSTWKTVVMHVLTTVPLSRWNRSAFARRLWDIMAYLDHCLQLTRLEHFVLGNERLPAEISLPPAMRGVEPPNLFEHLARDPAALREAMQAYGQLRFRLWVLLSSH